MKYEEIISKLTLEQKAALMTGRDFWSTMAYEELGIPSASLSDGPHGLRKQAAASDHLGLNASIPATCYPTSATMANSWNEELGEEMGRRLGEEAAVLDVNVLLGPGLNMKRNPRCGRNFEYFSEDPYLAGKMAAAYVRGIQKNGVSACVKHFAANNQEERRMVLDSVVDERTLREIYLTGFEIAVKEGGTRSIMSSYNRLNGEFTNENKHLLKDILRGEWGFDGVVVTDWAGCNSRVGGAEAGNELEMPACKYGADDLVKAVKDGTLNESVLDENIDRLLELVFATDKAVKNAPDKFDADEHHDIARRCAEETIVLLKNEGVLPLDHERKVAVIGEFAENPRYQGAGSSVVNPTKLDKFTDCLKQGEINCIGYSRGFDRFGKSNKSLVKNAVELAKNADTVLFFAGLDEVTEAEGLDRENIKIPANQLECLKAVYELGKKVVVILSCGSAVELDGFNDADALLHAYLGGQAGAQALYNVLTGKVNPSGKLSESYPVKYEDCPSSANFPGKQMTVEYREGPYIGYRYYTTAGVKVNYPFGFGLSYTTFRYSDLEIDDKGVSFYIENTGKTDGAEVAQMYVGKPDGEVFRPLRELKGFKKVFLAAGEKKRVEIAFDDYTFRYFNVKTDKWEVEGGEYRVEIGSSSETILLEGTIAREGTTDVLPYDRSKLPSYYSGKVANVAGVEFSELLGRPVPYPGYDFYKKNRMVIHENCTVADLRYSKGWTGRAFSGLVRFAIKFLRGIGKRTTANTLVMGVLHQPVRGIAKFGGMTRRKMEGLLIMFNGKFFKGLGTFLSKEKENTAK